MINDNKYFIKNGKSVRPIRVKKYTGLNEMPCTHFFFCYSATRANGTGFTEYLTHLIKITANMSVTLRQ